MQDKQTKMCNTLYILLYKSTQDFWLVRFLLFDVFCSILDNSRLRQNSFYFFYGTNLQVRNLIQGKKNIFEKKYTRSLRQYKEML